MQPTTSPLPSPSSSSASEHAHKTKGSRSRVSAEHTLNRVRENQRRHRARRRDHIATLEQRLLDAETQLAEAQAEIAALRAERDGGSWGVIAAGTRTSEFDDIPMQLQDEGREKEDPEFEDAARGVLRALVHGRNKEQQPAHAQTLTLMPLPSPSSITSSSEHPDVPQLQLQDIDIPEPSLLGTLSTIATLETIESLLPPSIIPPSGPPPCCPDENPPLTPTSPSSPSSQPTYLTPAAIDPECRSCKTRPPPSPSESTTPCSQAYVLIAQQNFRGIDAQTMRTWLVQGFRRAPRKGEGCRVENGALFRLLDYISGI
ncbi:uncharacterized protein BDR25DRAFT_335117 [Lindgomyces ingoldianus]|uniref:Uncharacterized protein n=1 Tax=Lindgomyces ingoldianus TaxID=673940 RepID=A0ACB6QQQ4_9PLEO|nr:uncharacterized protein BDR25DRAFT_335117 [Lindgomyces ingoldianus]KAF2469187.1 hypothetical protein BDR25DRAFT_335117 [Lindgomyces ingoldianus]